MQPEERDRLNVGQLDADMRRLGLIYLEAPIRDFGEPDALFRAGWETLSAELRGRLDSGGRVLVHCRAGLGRSGMIVAALLIEGGVPVDRAVTLVRSAQPGAIETDGQMAWLRSLA